MTKLVREGRDSGDILGLIVALVLAAGNVFGATAQVQYDTFTHSVRKPSTSTGSAYDLDFTGLSLGGIAGGSSTVPVAKTNYVMVGPIGNDGTAVAGRLDKPYLTIGAAVTAASSGDKVQVGPGTFTENSGIVLGSGVSLVGQGIGVTTINSSLTGAGHAVLIPGNNSYIADLTVNATGASGSPFGCLGSDTGSTGVIISGVNATGVIDSFNFAQSGVTVQWRIYDSILTSLYDTHNAQLGTSLDFEFWNCTFDATSNAGVNNSRAVRVSTGSTRLFNCKVTTGNVGGSSQNLPLVAIGGTLEAHNVRIHRDGTGSTVFDLQQTGGTLAVENVTRDDGAALATSGTITQLSRYAVRDNNLSDLPTPATARTNLGGTTVGQAFFTLTNPNAITFPRIDAGNTVTARSSANYKTDLGLVIGTNVQAWDTDLDSWAAITRASGFDTFTATPSSANLRALVTDENGTGAALFSGATSPTFVTPILGTPTSVTLTNATGLPPTTGIVGWPANSSGALTNNGSGTLSWVPAGGTGTVTSITATSPIVFTPNPITTTGTATLDVSVDHAFTAAQTITFNNPISGNSTDTALNLIKNTSQTPANGLGVGLGFSAKDSTTANQPQANISTAWSDVTHATRSAYMDFLLVNSGSNASKMRLFPSGGLSVNNTTDPGAGIVSANTGYKIASAEFPISSNGIPSRTSANTYSALTAPSGAIVGDTDTQTLTNKWVKPRSNTVASSATPTINTDTTDIFTITALAANITSMTTNLSGTPVEGQTLTIWIKDNATPRTITWGASFVSSGVATLLATTVASKTHYVSLKWNATASKWVCLAVDATGF